MSKIPTRNMSQICHTYLCKELISITRWYTGMPTNQTSHLTLAKTSTFVVTWGEQTLFLEAQCEKNGTSIHSQLLSSTCRASSLTLHTNQSK
jgi:hypothetical protein